MYNKPLMDSELGHHRAPHRVYLCVPRTAPSAPSSPRLAPPRLAPRRRVFVAMGSILGSKRKKHHSYDTKMETSCDLPGLHGIFMGI